ncbi:MAG: hypothetical protein K2L49_06620 [Muribaculaceae bacterium]|nr:hypothetical protein [Muribaculaceae bacterium]
MKTYKSYLGLMLSAAMAFGFTACQDDFDAPSPDSFVHTANITANTSILELKTLYWDDSQTNYVKQVSEYTQEMADKISASDRVGQPIIISGRVVSSDYTGNIYKTLVLQDESGAITIGIDATSLYAKYPMGQEVVIDATGMYIGKYNGLMQLGYDNNGGINRMPLMFFEQHAQRNGAAYIKQPDGSTSMNPVDTTAITIAQANSLVATQEGLRQWQSRLVRFNEVSFVDGGKETFATLEQTEKRYITDTDGNQLMVYNSGYSNFWSQIMPAGTGDVVGILSYYAASGWQLLLIDTYGCIGFQNIATPGSQENPYTVERAIEFEQAGNNKNAWVAGYIVGAVSSQAMAAGSVTSNDDIEWGPEATTLGNTLVIASAPGVHDIDKCLVFNLPTGSSLQQYANMQEHPENYNKRLALVGTLAKVMGTYGLTGNNGTSSEFELEGVDVPDDGQTPTPPTGDVTFTKVTSVTSGKGYMMYTDGMYATPLNEKYGYGYLYGTAVTENAGVINSDAANAFTLTATDGGYYLSDTYGRYLYMTGSFDSFNVSATATKGDQSYIWTVEPQTDGRFKITNASTGKYIQYDAAPTTGTNTNPRFCSKNTDVGSLPYLYEMDGTAVAPTPPSEGGDTPGPDVPVTGNTADFNTLNNGETYKYYTTPFTSAQGWKTENCMLIQGDNNGTNEGVTFAFIGGPDVFAPVLNGKTTTPGKITSPTIAGGISKLSFNYGFPFTDTKCKFTINIKQNGNIVQTKTEELTNLTKFTAYSYSWEVSVSGDFSIEIINDCLSNSTSNKDRLAIWNLTWEN